MLNLIAKDFGNIGENFATYGGNVTLTGVAIVFCMLVLLVLIISAFGFVMSSGDRKSKKQMENEAKSATETANPVVVETVNCDDNEVIAAISAAVSMMYEGSGKTPIIRSVKPAIKGNRSAWGMAGVVDNTRAF